MDRKAGLGPGDQEPSDSPGRSPEPDDGSGPRPAPPGRRPEPPGPVEVSASPDEPAAAPDEAAEHVLRPVPPWRHRFGLPNQEGPRPDPPIRPVGPSSSSRRRRLLVLGSGVFVVALGAFGVVMVAEDGSDDGPVAGQVQGDVDGDASEDEAASAGETDAGGSPTTERVDPEALPPPEIPPAADPPAPTRDVADLAFPVSPLDGDDVWPAVGTLTVGTGSGAYADASVHLEAGELVVTLDGYMDATVEVYGPHGKVVAAAEVSGEPGPEDVVQFIEDALPGPLEETGTHVVRVVKHGGPDDDMTITFFTPDSTT